MHLLATTTALPASLPDVLATAAAVGCVPATGRSSEADPRTTNDSSSVLGWGGPPESAGAAAQVEHSCDVRHASKTVLNRDEHRMKHVHCMVEQWRCCCCCCTAASGPDRGHMITYEQDWELQKSRWQGNLHGRQELDVRVADSYLAADYPEQ